MTGRAPIICVMDSLLPRAVQMHLGPQSSTKAPRTAIAKRRQKIKEAQEKEGGLAVVEHNSHSLDALKPEARSGPEAILSWVCFYMCIF